jgi:hypothetical protein
MIRETIIGSVCISVFVITMVINPFEQSKGELLILSIVTSMLVTSLIITAFILEDMHEGVMNFTNDKEDKKNEM